MSYPSASLNDSLVHSPSVVKAGFDVASLSTLYAWWVGVAPAIATTLTIAWVMYCFAEVGYVAYKKWKNK